MVRQAATAFGTWFRRRFQPHRRLYLADFIGSQPVCTSHSPIEHVVSYVDATFMRRKGRSDDATLYPGLGGSELQVCASVCEREWFSDSKSISVVLRSAASFENQMSEVLDAAERHLWRWLTLSQPRATIEDVREFVFEKMDACFRSLRDRYERDLRIMTDLVDRSVPLRSMILGADGAKSMYESDAVMADVHKELMVMQFRKEIARDYPHLGEDAIEVMALAGFEILFSKAAAEAGKAGHSRSAVRRSIKRAYKLIERLGAAAELSDLIHRRPLVLGNQASPFRFRISLRDETALGVFYHTEFLEHSVPFVISIETSDGQHLSNLCIYAEKTPILDFFLALKLHIDTGEEQLLLEQGNWYHLGPLDFVRAYLAARQPALLKKVPPAPTTNEKIPPRFYPDGDPMPEWAWWSTQRPFDVAEHLPYADRRPMLWEPATWQFGYEPIVDGEGEYIFDSKALAKYIPLARQALSEWFGPAIARWDEIREPLQELIVLSGVQNRDPGLPARALN